MEGVNTGQLIGEKHKGAKLTEAKVREIREKYADPDKKIRMQDLADEYGVSLSAIHLIINGLRWKHVK